LQVLKVFLSRLGGISTNRLANTESSVLTIQRSWLREH
jgi:hypothetical protein